MSAPYHVIDREAIAVARLAVANPPMPVPPAPDAGPLAVDTASSWAARRAAIDAMPRPLAAPAPVPAAPDAPARPPFYVVHLPAGLAAVPAFGEACCPDGSCDVCAAYAARTFTHPIEAAFEAWATGAA